jgi:hypothetical protein
MDEQAQYEAKAAPNHYDAIAERDTSPVDGALDRLTRAIALLDELLDNLTGRLRPVLHDVNPAETAEAQIGLASDPNESPVVTTIAARATAVEGHDRRVRSLIERLDV